MFQSLQIHFKVQSGGRKVIGFRIGHIFFQNQFLIVFVRLNLYSEKIEYFISVTNV